jgi:pteridine reductase
VSDKKKKTVMITGAAKRIGAATAKLFHSQDYFVLLHYNRSATAAKELHDTLNNIRSESCALIQADLNCTHSIAKIAELPFDLGRLDVLVNNASSFYPTPLQQCDTDQWDDLINSNLKGPFFLSRILAPLLTQSCGAIVNISDMHARQALHDHPIYTIAKAGNIAMTKSLAKELAPHIRVNSVAPGAILWPENNGSDSDEQAAVLEKVPMGRLGSQSDIAEAVYFLAARATYITGQTIAVDGGRSNSL